MDSSLGSNLSPTLSPDMKGFFKEKLRSMKPRKANKVRVEEPKMGLSAGGTSASTGYSHLDCCADVPYNLAEEPEQVCLNVFLAHAKKVQVDGVEGDEGECRSVLDHSFTSSVLEEASRSRRVDEVEVEGGGGTRSKNFLDKMLSTSHYFQVQDAGGEEET